MKSNKYIRVVAFSMLFAMVHYMVGYRLVYSFGILYAKEEAKECVVEKNHNIQKITLSVPEYNSLKWTENNKEFSLNNEMYDVVSIQETGNNYLVTVYSDSIESSWVASLHNYEKELFQPDKSTKGAKSASDIMSSFQKDYTPTSKFNIYIYTSKGPSKPAVAVQQHLLKISNNIWHPPLNC